jgi:hypothetical protein
VSEIKCDLVAQKQDISRSLSDYNRLKLDETEKITREAEANALYLAESAASTEQALNVGFENLESSFSERLVILKAELQKELVDFEIDSDLCFRLDVMKAEEERNAHFQSILDAQRESLSAIQEFFSTALKESGDEIAIIERDVSEMYKRKELNSEEIMKLEDANDKASAPVEQLQRVKVGLLEGMKIVNGGTMALNNFRNSLRALERDLKVTEDRINQQMKLNLSASSYAHFVSMPTVFLK